MLQIVLFIGGIIALVLETSAVIYFINNWGNNGNDEFYEK